MKKFFQEIKADIKFKSAGPGQKLTGERAPKEKPNQTAVRQPRQGPTNEAQMAAAAALARLEQKQPKARGPTSQESIRNQVRKELRAEATVSGSTEAPGTNMVPEPREEGSAHLAVPGVCFTCPLTGATLRKDQRDAHIKEAILSHFSTDPVAASIMKIHTFNRDRDKVKLGVDTIAKYLDNICLHPEEEKYRKIKLQNKVFQERINCLEGTHEFFEAIGFQKALLPVPDQEGPEEFYVLSEAAVAEPQSLQRHKDQLLVAEPVRATLARQRRVFRPSPMASQFDLPGDFFNLTAEEIKREQRLRSEAVERLSVLRTKAMREREEQRELRKYTYTLLRVRLPDGCLLQGTFYARERVGALYAFVREALQSDWLPFDLLASGGQKLSEEDSLAFNECGLVPSALLTFSWDAAVLDDIRAAGAEPNSSILKPELLAAIEKLS
ncbi:UBX domain-containing protein 6 isoform X2 [Canis lupus baileyi]|uniref:UBX domain-containing protein 6 isoform X2 n=1 Tax=Canis lupus dingo TaxID=286419 RepID=UPI000DC68081|nr:UBX domain-containing protein 6 isoform X2 [Canis lupus dingo]XP_038284982.1 UBX domain-containing protein 6 isoform X2 [Canis lupus familiaris]XP_038311898.1 UBX domain-containing protein 6 isoform X2 [Canis lupus familiaris]